MAGSPGLWGGRKSQPVSYLPLHTQPQSRGSWGQCGRAPADPDPLLAVLARGLTGGRAFSPGSQVRPLPADGSAQRTGPSVQARIRPPLVSSLLEPCGRALFSDGRRREDTHGAGSGGYDSGSTNGMTISTVTQEARTLSSLFTDTRVGAKQEINTQLFQSH